MNPLTEKKSVWPQPWQSVNKLCRIYAYKKPIRTLSAYIYCLLMYHFGFGSWRLATKLYTSRCSPRDILHSYCGLVTPTHPGPHCSVIPKGETEHLDSLSSNCESLSWLRLSCGRRCSNSCQHQNISPPLTGQ